MPYSGINSVIIVGFMAGIGKKSRERLGKVLETNPAVMTSAQVVKELNVSNTEACRLLSRWHKSGWLHRVKRGVYIPASIESDGDNFTIEEPILIADSIYAPGYVGGFSAIKHWDLSEQIIETTYYLTTKKVKDRNPVHASTKFKLKTISEYKIFGIKSLWYGSKKVKISDATKTIVDILDDPKLVGGMTIVNDVFNEYLESDYANHDLLIEYAEKMNNKTIFKRLGFLVDTLSSENSVSFNNLEAHISSGYSEFDPLVKGDVIVDKWKLKVPLSWKKKYDRKK